MTINDMIAWLETRGFKVIVTQTKTGNLFRIAKYDYHAASIYEDGFGGEIAQQQFLDRLLSSWEQGYRLSRETFKKKTILVGLSNRSLGWDFFKAVLDSLDRYSIKYDHVDCIRLRFETKHTKTWFVFANDPYDMLAGIRADAVFGSEYERLLYRAKPDAFIAHRKGVGLVDYISDIEERALGTWRPYPVEGYGGTVKRYEYVLDNMDVPSMYPSTLCMKPLSQDEKRLYKHMLNAIYGKFGTLKKFDWPDYHDVIDKAGNLRPDYLRSVTERMCKEITKEVDARIYNELTKGENNMNNVYSALAMNKSVYLDVDGSKVPIYIDGIEVHSEWGSTETTFKGHIPNFYPAPNTKKNTPTTKLPGIKTVHFSGPCTVVIWEDKTKTVVRCNNENVDYEKGLAMAITKKAFGTNKSGSNYYDIFKKWLPKAEEEEVTEEKVEKPVEAEAVEEV